MSAHLCRLLAGSLDPRAVMRTASWRRYTLAQGTCSTEYPVEPLPASLHAHHVWLSRLKAQPAGTHVCVPVTHSYETGRSDRRSGGLPHGMLPPPCGARMACCFA